ncbi:MAG: TIGR00341 family protein [Halohasta sp.]
MRLVQVSIPTGSQQAVTETLDDAGVDYVVTDETSSREFGSVATFPLPTNAVEPVLADLREVGIDDSTYTVIVDAKTVISHQFDQLEAEYTDEGNTSEQIAREELQTDAKNLVSGRENYLLMTVISSVVATAGLLLDSPATVVGSMVIAPLIGPALAASVGTVVDDHELFVRGIKLQLSGMAVAIGSAALFAAALRFGNLVPPGLDPLTIGEVRERLAPNMLVLAVALGSGVAGMISLMTGVSVALVGVMIAVALIPPAAAMGIGIAYGIPSLTLGSGVFVLVNVLSINLAALVVLWLSGYRPEAWFRISDVRSKLFHRVAALAVSILLLSVFLGGITYDTHQATDEERQIELAVDEVFDGASYEGAHVDEITISRTEAIMFSEVEGVEIDVSVPPDRPFPPVARPLDEAIEAELGSEVTVEVRFVEVETVD